MDSTPPPWEIGLNMTICFSIYISVLYLVSKQSDYLMITSSEHTELPENTLVTGTWKLGFCPILNEVLNCRTFSALRYFSVLNIKLLDKDFYILSLFLC